uniref:FAS-associated factor 1 n=1 Tax=Ascaris suum TaxID=6253 RepID=F1L1H1_ASCSU
MMGDNRHAAIELSGAQSTLLSRYQEIANEEDKRRAIEVLSSVDWDLQRAIEIRLAGDSTEDDHSTEYGASAPVHDVGRMMQSGVNDVDDDSMWVDGADFSNGLSRSNGASSSQESAVTTTTGTPGQPLQTRLHSETDHAQPVAVSGMSTADRDSDSEVFDGPLELDDTAEGVSRPIENVPLVPSEFANVPEAISNFVAVFEARYGYNHPHFYEDTLEAAMREAFEAPGRSIAERRPFAIYVHNDNSIASNIFAKNVLCSDSVTSLLNAQFVTWAWDATQEANKSVLVNWLQRLDVREAHRVVRRARTEHFPLLLLVTKEKGVVQMFDMCSGFDAAADVMNMLMNGLGRHKYIKDVEEAEEKQRQEREMIREEQRREYEESLARDRAVHKALQRQKQEQREEEMRRMRAEADKVKRMTFLATVLPPEPGPTDDGVVMVRVRFPDGRAEVRRFRNTDALRNLITFIESKGYDMKEYRVWNSDVPKKNVMECFDLYGSFADLKWPVREQVYVEEK